MGTLALAVASCGDASDEQNAETPETVATQEEAREKQQAVNWTQGTITTLESGLKIEVLVAGDGSRPSIDDEVLVDYEGRLTTGEVFDSSYERGKAARFGVANLIKGWTEALQLMPAGSKWRLTIPPQLAYGERELDGIPANSILVFDMELIDIIAAPKANEDVAAVIATAFATHECGSAPEFDPEKVRGAMRRVLHEEGNAWQDCMETYIKSSYMMFETKGAALRQIPAQLVPSSQKQAVNEYFSNAYLIVTQAEKDLSEFEGIPAQ